MVLKIVRTVWPVMLTYVAIGAPCGMIMGQTGMEPWMVFCPEQHVCDGQRPVYDLQSLAGGCTGTFDYRERCRHLLAFCALLGIDRAASDGCLEASDAGCCRDTYRGGIWHLACQVG